MPMFCILGPLCYFIVHLLSMIKKMGGGMSRDSMKAVQEMKASGGGDAVHGDKYFSMAVLILHPSLVRETLYLFPCQQLEMTCQFCGQTRVLSAVPRCTGLGWSSWRHLRLSFGALGYQASLCTA